MISEKIYKNGMFKKKYEFRKNPAKNRYRNLSEDEKAKKKLYEKTK